MSEFKNFTNHLQDKIFEETSIYLSDVIGSYEWGEEAHEVHGTIMWNAVEAIAKEMGIIKNK
jgi:hypothetical protein